MSDFDAQVDASALPKLLEEAERRNRDHSPVMSVIAEGLVADVSDEYDTEGHGQWPPLAESTIRKRRQGGAGAKILQDTGRAAASTQPDSGPDFAEASTDVAYMVFHTAEGARSVIPYRNPFDLPEDAFDRATQTLLDSLVLP